MNERIRELAEQSGYGARWTTTEQFEGFMEKFARLIVLECAEAVENSIWHLPRGYKATDQADFLKKHFGVE